MANVLTPRRGADLITLKPNYDYDSLATLDKACHSGAILRFSAAMFVNTMSVGVEAFGGHLVVERIAGVRTVVCNTAGYTTYDSALQVISVDIGAAFDASAFTTSTTVNFWRTGYSGQTPAAWDFNGYWHDGTSTGGSYTRSVSFNPYPRPACGTKPTHYAICTVEGFAYDWTSV